MHVSRRNTKRVLIVCLSLTGFLAVLVWAFGPENRDIQPVAALNGIQEPKDAIAVTDIPLPTALLRLDNKGQYVVDGQTRVALASLYKFLQNCQDEHRLSRLASRLREVLPAQAGDRAATLLIHYAGYRDQVAELHATVGSSQSGIDKPALSISLRQLRHFYFAPDDVAKLFVPEELKEGELLAELQQPALPEQPALQEVEPVSETPPVKNTQDSQYARVLFTGSVPADSSVPENNQ